MFEKVFQPEPGTGMGMCWQPRHPAGVADESWTRRSSISPDLHYQTPTSAPSNRRRRNMKAPSGDELTTKHRSAGERRTQATSFKQRFHMKTAHLTARDCAEFQKEHPTRPLTALRKEYPYQRDHSGIARARSEYCPAGRR
jgi:hypothetical protein